MAEHEIYGAFKWNGMKCYHNKMLEHYEDDEIFCYFNAVGGSNHLKKLIYKTAVIYNLNDIQIIIFHIIFSLI